MKKLFLLLKIVFVICITSYAPPAFGWGVSNHEDISEAAVENSVLVEKFGNFAKSNLGLGEGLGTTVAVDPSKNDNEKGLTPVDMVKRGAAKEDSWCWETDHWQEESDVSCLSYLGRFNHHYHNPLKDWDEAGLNDWSWDWLSGSSSLLWAQNDEQAWSWNNLREMYYEALMAIDNKTGQGGRKFRLAKIFRGIGHQLHLIQDKAVPYHVRNDSHARETLVPGFYQRMGGGLYFESWAVSEDNRKGIKSLANNSVRPELDLKEKIENRLPVAKLIDTNTYDGTNPSACLSVGLSEFTNANFFSADTIFAAERYEEGDKYYFPYPEKDDTNLQAFIDERDLPLRHFESGDTEFVISLVADRMEIDHFVQPTYHTRSVSSGLGLYTKTFYLSERCHEDYVEKLVPRASGYSTELIDYFFRGSIDISLPENGVYSMFVPGNEIDQDNYDSYENVFDSITLGVENTSLYGEQLNEGTIELVLEYTTVQEYPFRNFWDLYDDNGYKPEYSNYHQTIIKSDMRQIPDSPVEWKFDLSHDPIPLNAVDLHLYLVYRGKLGAEENGVAVGYKNVSAPTPFVIYNTCDQICMNGEWYDAGSDEVVNIVDEADSIDGFANPYYCNEYDECYDAEYDVYPHGAANMCFVFHPVDSPRSPDCDSTNEERGEVFVDYLAPGEHHRFFILSDYEYGYTNNRADTIVPGDHCPPGFPYTGYSWLHDRFTGGITTGSATAHGLVDGFWVLPAFWEKYNTQSTFAHWYRNREYPPDAGEDGDITCEFSDFKESK